MTLNERFERATTLLFLRSLFQRAIDGETLKAGESYIFFAGQGVEERKATQADIDQVTVAVHNARNTATR
jgi:hypothetical protein